MTHDPGAAAPHVSAMCAGEDLRARFRYAAKRERQMLAQVCKLIEQGDMRRVRRQIRAYLLSHNAKLAALAAVNAKRDRSRQQKNGRFGQDRRLPLASLLDVACRMHLLSASSEMVAVKPIAKSRGRFRPVCMFEIEHQARQQMLRRVLELFKHRLNPIQFLFVGRPAALKAAAHAIETEGFRFAVELDVINQFGTFDEGALHEFLPELPAKSVRANLVPTNMALSYKKLASIPPHHTAQFKSSSRMGLPQGASSSPLVAEMLMAKVLTEIPWENLSQVSVVIYADNILVLGHTEASATAACECLSDGFGRSAVGSLRLKMGTVKSLSRGVDFLGMKVRLESSRTTVSVTPRRWRRFASRLQERWSETRCPRQIAATVRSWAASSSLDPRAGFAAALMGEAVRSHPVNRRNLDAIGRLARRSLAPSGTFSLTSVMLETPRGAEWRAIKFAVGCN